MSVVTVQNILLSVSNKHGVHDFLSKIVTPKVQIFSSDGSYAALKERSEIPDTQLKRISDYTDHPRFGDRVKTIDFRLYAGILAKKKEEFYQTFHDGIFFDMVICNLYPFETAVDDAMDIDRVCAFIDIGGMGLLRAAAKNFTSVCVLSDPAQYHDVGQELARQGGISLATRYRLCQETFSTTAQYEQSIAEYFSKRTFTSFFHTKGEAKHSNETF